MAKIIRTILLIFATFVVFGVVQKALFIALYHDVIDIGAASAFALAVRHGLAMDCSVAGYLTAIPALLLTGACLGAMSVIKKILKGYFAIIAVVVAAITTIDLGLYAYWGFRLDATPIFYFTTSPSAALASVEWWQGIVGTIATAALAAGLFATLWFVSKRVEPVAKTKRAKSAAICLLVTAGLFLPIRGGVTVSTMNLSHCYFSTNQRLNHAAINPFFSLLYSLTHQADFSSQYRFMADDEAEALMTATHTRGHSQADTLLTCSRPDIYLIILESFSAHLMPSLGGEDIAVGLDSLAREGISFSRCYASSFRTDRALPAILSGFPAQPSTSIMKFTDKIERLPGIAGELAAAGYSTAYYYGGDANFTNMKAYLKSTGFETIISDADFAVADKASKWGAHDHLVFQRALADIRTADTATPHFRVIQTSSSHEPFEVPYSNPRFAGEPKKNAFAYTDSCLTAFVDALKALPGYDRALIVIVPDHLGAWPENLDRPADRHHIPLVITGGALARRGATIDTPAAQTDIAATLLAMLGLDHDKFTFSRDLFDAATPHFAFFSEPSVAAMVTPTDTAVVYLDSDRQPAPSDTTARLTQAYLQTLYSTIDKL